MTVPDKEIEEEGINERRRRGAESEEQQANKNVQRRVGKEGVKSEVPERSKITGGDDADDDDRACSSLAPPPPRPHDPVQQYEIEDREQRREREEPQGLGKRRGENFDDIGCEQAPETHRARCREDDELLRDASTGVVSVVAPGGPHGERAAVDGGAVVGGGADAVAAVL
eukprot:CAMPEP_0198669494 /NCGR_PEP_ID=MMETSP1467-20131203/76409_1 /TAXON_ID=1462469 /ORGANISM="unid. sp., Strain CCMP2135" /LENGTH=169 /DNA_ID=CAMNT_0044406249 /DNA_START=63 /DNA_END=569 /DNA_ORIENTATION=-